MTITAKGASATLTVDGEWLIIDAKVYRGTRRVALSTISAVDWKSAGTFLQGCLTLHVMGVPDPYVFVFRKKALSDFEALRDAIQGVRS